MARLHTFTLTIGVGDRYDSRHNAGGEALNVVIDKLSRLRCYPYNEREFVAFVTPGDLPAPKCREVDTSHDEFVVVSPTAVSFSVALERSRWTVKSPSGHG